MKLANPAAAGRRDLNAPTRPGGPSRIAIVEDQAPLVESLIELIHRAGEHEVIGAYADGEAALEHIPRLKPDLVLMDIGLPGVSGVECVRQLKAILPDLTIVMLTGYNEGEYLFNSLKAGASGYLLKLSAQDKLLEAISDALLGGVPLTSQMATNVARYFHQIGAVTSEIDRLSPRELDTLSLLSDGYRYKEIADRLGLRIDTVREYVCSTYRKLHVTSRTEAVVKYLKNRKQ
jgi:DNA-binding NarL/FixJ family response regulator